MLASQSLQQSVLARSMTLLRMQESYAAQLVHDLDEDAMDLAMGPGLENTPRFTLGHLCVASALTVWVLQHPSAGYGELKLDVPAEYCELFQRMGPGDRRAPSATPIGPGSAALLAELHRQHDRIEAQLRMTPDEVLTQRRAWKLAHHLPTIADIVMFQAVHEMLHLGQLAAWRRARGLPAAMARMAEHRL